MYKKVTTDEMAKRTRSDALVSRFENTPEWKLMRKDLEAGLKPKDVLQVSLTVEQMAEYGITSYRTIPRFLQKYIEAEKLPYVVRRVRRGNTEYITVRHG